MVLHFAQAVGRRALNASATRNNAGVAVRDLSTLRATKAVRALSTTAKPSPPSMTPPVSLLVEKPSIAQFDPPKRLLMGPGPGNAHPRVHAAMSLPQVGHMDGAFLAAAEDIKTLLRYAWQTKNAFTVPCSGTGSAAWEAAVANLTSPGDTHLVLVNGYFGLRHCDMASRYGANIVKLEKPWGEVFSDDEVAAALAEHKPDTLLVAHAETSTGACQPMANLGDMCRDVDCLLMADTVTSIGGLPVKLDEWGVDACYAGGQKALSCPPGIAPLTFGDRALRKMDERQARGEVTANWYLDMNMIKQYLVVNDFGVPRVYHHTAPISMAYALREALTILAEEGLEASWARHRASAEFFWDELEKIGLECHVPWEHRLPTLTTVKIPEGVDGGKVVTFLRENYNIEIAGGLGQLAGKVWRIGLMGYNSRKENAALVCAALRDALDAQGYYRAPGLLYKTRAHSRTSFHGSA
jgi:alanine-glyoxylate transaminase/serine-glyoxylate transaminase/serine-pyruvate transaminase